jgi:hypothetical protein
MSSIQKQQHEQPVKRCVLRNSTDHEVVAHIQRLLDPPLSPPWYAMSEFDLLLHPGISYSVEMRGYDMALAKQHGLVIEEVQT